MLLLLLVVMIFVVVVLMVTMVIFWCLQSSWLCVCVCWPSACGGDDVVSCVVNVDLEVVMVVICCCCDGVSHGEILVALGVLASCLCIVMPWLLCVIWRGCCG